MAVSTAGAASAEPDGWYGAIDAGYQFIIGPNDVAMLFNAAREAHVQMQFELGSGGTTPDAARSY